MADRWRVSTRDVAPTGQDGRLRSFATAAVTAIVLAATLAVSPVGTSGAAGAVATGSLRVTTSPAVGTTIVVDGIERDTWGLDWLEIEAGAHLVCATDVVGFATPDCETVHVPADGTGTAILEFEPLARLRLTTSPAVASTITTREHPGGSFVPRDDWGVDTWTAAGRSIEVCAGAVEAHLPPPCTVIPGELFDSSFNLDIAPLPFVASPDAPGETGKGLLRVTTDPPVPSTISIDGAPADDWGLDWVKVAPGTHTVCFSDVPGHRTPGCSTVNVSVGSTTTVTGEFSELGFIRATTRPAQDVPVVVDGVARDNWGAWLPIEPGTHTVCFGFDGACETVTVAAGQTSDVSSDGDLDPDDPAAVQAAWQTILNAPIPAMGFTGNVAACDPGTTSAEYRQAELDIVNAFRRLAGVGPAVEDPTFSAQAQQAALIMAATGDVSHTPPPDWNCWTSVGAQTAADSNLALIVGAPVEQSNGPAVMRGYVEDPGDHNAAVGHRRWLLCPATEVVGFGDVPTANAMKIMPFTGTFDGSETRDGVVTWPNRGVFPASQADPYLDRMNLMVPHFWDVSAATVTITADAGGSVVPVELVRDTGYACSPAVAWKPSRPPAAGQTWTFHVAGLVDAQGVSRTITWSTGFVSMPL